MSRRRSGESPSRARSSDCSGTPDTRRPTTPDPRSGGGERNDEGFTLIEMVAAFTLLAAVILAVSASLATGFSLVQKAKVNQITSTLVNAEIERIRALRDQASDAGESDVAAGGYEAIGTKSPDNKLGNPPGEVLTERAETVRGIEFKVSVHIDWVEDQIGGLPKPGASKLVTVTVQPTSSGVGKAVTAKTIIAPETSSNPAAVKFKVKDAGSGGVEDVGFVGVRLSEGGFDIKHDLTDSNGEAVFAGLTPGVTYTAEISDLNWPASMATCDPVTVTPNALDLVTVTCQVAKPLTLNVDVVEPGGGPPAGEYALAIWMEGNSHVPIAGEVFFSGSSPFAPSAPATKWALTHISGEEMRQNVTYYLALWGPGVEPVWQPVSPEKPPSGDFDVKLTLNSSSGGGALALTVEQGGGPVPNARILVVDSVTGTEVLRYAVTSPAGQITVDLAPGSYDLIAEKNGAQSTVQSVTVSDGATDPYTLVLP